MSAQKQGRSYTIEQPSIHLVLRKHRGKPIRRKAHFAVGLSKVRRLLFRFWIQHGQVLRSKYLRAHVECLRSLLRNKQVVAGHHLHIYT